MNTIEVLFCLFAAFLSYRLGIYFVGQIGWLGFLPAVILGIGLVAGVLFVLRRVVGRQKLGPP
jgi:hypothetical protein